MTTTETTTGLSTDLMKQLQAAANQAAQGVRDPEAMRRACQSLDRLREEIRQKHGELDVVVPALRERRDDA